MDTIRKTVFLGILLTLGIQIGYALNDNVPATTNLSAQLINVVNPSCNGASDGSFEIEVTGGVAPYETAIVGSNTGFQNTLVYTGLSFNLYNIVVRDANGDTFTINSFLLTQPSALGLSSTTVDETCNGNDGTVTLSGFGGTAPYSYSFEGSRFGTTDTFSGLAAGTYTASVEDANGCTSNATITIGAYVPRTIAINQVADITCNGGSNAHVFGTVIGSGTVLPIAFSLDGVNFSSSNSFPNLSAGNYTMYVRDGNNCISTQTFDITEPAPLTAAIISTAISCFGIDDGTYGWDVSGGTAPYTLQQGGNIIANFNGNNFTQTNVPGNTSIAAGTYDIVDANGCSIPSPAVAVAGPPSALVTSITTVNASCNETSDGSITVSASGSVGTYTYSIDGVNFQSSPTFSNLAAGTYDVSTLPTGFPGCLETKTVTITEPAAITGTTSVDSDVSNCNGATDGVISVANISGGDGNYQFSIDGGNSFQTSGTFTGLATGNYDIIIEDGNGCSITLSETINEPTGSGTIETTDPTCAGASDGSFQFTGFIPTNSSSIPTVTINGNNQGNLTSIPYTGLTAGNYQIDVLDAGGCTTSFNITLTDPTPIATTVAIDQEPLCNNSADGIVTVTASGGVGPYEYKLSTDNTYSSNSTLTGLIDGSNTIDVRDANGCVFSTNITLAAPTALSVTATVTDISCNGLSDGSLSILPAGGTAPYTYSIDGVNFGSSDTFNQLSAGTYTVTVLDANSCSTTSSITIVEPSPINITFQALPPSCIGNSDGQIQINLASGGTGPIRIRLRGTTTPDFRIENLAPGAYEVEAVDGNGCIVTNTVTVPESAPLSADVTVDSNASGCGNSDGAFTLSNPRKGGVNITFVEYSIDGVNYQTSPSFTGLAAGVYTVDIRDITPAHINTGNCQGTVSVTITEPSSITGTLSTTDILCNGDSNGSIDVTNVTGGVAPYQYSIDGVNFTTNTSFTSLSGGAYNVTIRDASNCTTVINTTVQEAPAITVMANIDQQITCNGNTDGAITVNASGGTGNLEYSIDGTTFTSGNTFAGLGPNTYTITVKDDNNCTVTSQVTITEPAPLSGAIVTVTNPTCAGANDGSVLFSISGGTAPYELSNDGTQFFPLPPNNMFENLGALTVPTIRIRDANGCTLSINGFTITDPAPITADLVSTGVSCNGDTDGTITVTPTSTTSTSFEYSLDGTNFSANNSFSQLASGNYTVSIRESGANCVYTFNATVSEPDILEVFPTEISISCNGATDGQIVGGAMGGTAPYAYSIDGGTTFQTTPFTGLSAGSYTVMVQDANNCTDSKIITITGPNALIASVSVTNNASCNGASDGLAVLSTTGGTAPYTYSLDGQNFSSNLPDLTNLAAGSYAVHVRDANACDVMANFSITEPTAIVPTLTTSDISCNGSDDGSITAMASGGSGNYMYSIDGVNFSSANAFSNLSPGSYTITVQDGNNCTGSAQVEITEPDALSLNFEAVDITCNGANDGQIAGIASGGTGPYQYSLDGNTFQSTAFSGLSSGNYTLTVLDANNCTTTASVDIIEPAVLTSAITVTNVSCNGSGDGSAALTVSGGSTPYTFSLDGQNFNTSIDLTNLAADSYTVVIRDANACEVVQNFDITEPDALGISISSQTDLTCFGDTNGSVTVTGSGGTAPLEYSIDGTNFVSSNTFDQLSAGNHTLTVRDANQCTESIMVQITSPAELSATSTVTDVSCNGLSDGSFSLVGSGGTGPYEYSADGMTFSTTSTFDQLVAGTYLVTIRDSNLCTQVVSVSVNQPDVISGSETISHISCNGESDGEISVVATGGTGPYQYSIDGTNFSSVSSFDQLAAGSYTITIRDNNMCTGTVTAAVNEPAVISLTETITNVSCNGGTDGSVTIAATGGTGNFSYSIDGTTFQSSSTFSGLAAGSYSITVEDDNSCSAMLSISISEPVALAATSSRVDVTCNGAMTGEITINASGGTGTLEYSLDGSTFQSSSTFTGLSADAYTVTIRDANGCTTSVSANIAEPSALSVSASLVDDNTISASATGGTAPYRYSIDGNNFQSSPTFEGLTNGTYTITVIDDNGCTASISQALIITSIDDPFAGKSISTYPNPAQNYFIISEVNRGDQISLINLNGHLMDQVLVEKSQKDLKYDISNVRQGVFLVVIKNQVGKTIAKRRVIKMN
ncbi:hypothetical protein BFP97_06995 [Roseivirga sp. 4D4]|uniref:T9SS type A sorting domain-containing protein n=1 Tax=Roseivirga sp. 4D4 TaxID=1889784 RepID=UPI000852E048|nr:T9SS type A sorting domain-containing protein [Roseivirga sp. 4D4]OEK01273.1 hypothetical protein BFP97_06995 [Roseivirga sp. 4D4]